MTRKEVINKVLNIAVEEIGYIEKASNSQLDEKEANIGDKNFTKYARDCFPELQGLSWCCMFIWWIFEKAYGKIMAQNILGMKTAKCSYLCEHMQKVDIENIDIGDIIFFKNEGGINHIGIIDCIVNNDVWTIEGNTSRKNENSVIANGGGIFSRYYNRYNPRIACVCRPRYDYLYDEKEEEKYIPEYNAEINAYNVNIRMGAGVEYRKVGQETKGYKLKIMSEELDRTHRKWYKFEYKGAYSYICADYIKRI